VGDMLRSEQGIREHLRRSRVGRITATSPPPHPLVVKLKEFLVVKLKEFFRRRGIFVSRTTDLQKIKRLISRLLPRTFDGTLIRLGPNGDGGYLVPDDLDNIAACISPGVSFEAGFDLDMAKRAIPVFMFDASVTEPPIKHPLFHFLPLFLGPETCPGFTTLDEICEKHAPKEGDLLLQMDIEGAEYDVLATVSDRVLQRFRIIVIEMHNFETAFQVVAYGRIQLALSRLAKFHEIVHIHPNNFGWLVRSNDVEMPDVLEITYLRKDRAKFAASSDPSIPHPLDFANTPERPDITISSWLNG
jgi:hypothetical protein